MQNQDNTSLRRIIYLSTAIEDLTQEDLADILGIARKRNEEMQITGLLLHHKGHFVQVIEGPEDNLSQVYKSIYNDLRHHRIICIENHVKVDARLFSDWKMGFLCSVRDHIDQADMSAFLDLIDDAPKAIDDIPPSAPHSVLSEFQDLAERFHKQSL